MLQKILSEAEILKRFDALVESGEVRYDKQTEVIEYVDQGFKFLFMVATSLSQKPNTPEEKDVTEQTFKPPLEPGSDINTAGFEICDVGTKHRLCANKFCYTRPQLLLLTRDGFKRQWDPLEAVDLDGIWTVLQDGQFAFYNCGVAAGFSRLHRHMQFVPRPEGFTTFLDADEDDQGAQGGGGSANVPFLYFRRALDGSGRGLKEVYDGLRSEMAARSKFRSEGPGTDCPHNLIMTRQWMAVIPRRSSVLGPASTNSIGMMGLVPVSTRESVEEWKSLGPLHVLKEFGVPRDGS
ncbi:hypothetical protein MGG_01873 [Pyricularia oryzae 70-15]|uniref:Uncharacterized protein n=3 Tax=Pyricularia oryzae TaxID=318829 RepID=G4MWN2_PYRO7|nr:uncharacterized protein MGG_01873 [Pyricularia oryzae 70-15]EHA55087.1 hypothetical protein MGG_01873 [Pyricularia oryzae 70-15]ELQ41658.1 hypothetical protein OOU_Y34scaffold00261g8 [Pyricularia oryzae Y34]KAI7921276.1 hypothetical protein M0657_006143 [Pyricularia oryzae]KAI7924060.1 hypothetical protein M9X92_004021 [Pyricularia oryzae]